MLFDWLASNPPVSAFLALKLQVHPGLDMPKY